MWDKRFLKKLLDVHEDLFLHLWTILLSYCGFTSSRANNYAVFYVQRMKNEDKIILHYSLH